MSTNINIISNNNDVAIMTKRKNESMKSSGRIVESTKKQIIINEKFGGHDIDIENKSKYGYVYELTPANRGGFYGSGDASKFKDSFEYIDNKYQNIKNDIQQKYTGEELEKRLNSLDSDYKNVFTEQVKFLHGRMRVELKMQELAIGVHHVDESVNARAMGKDYDFSLRDEQLKYIKDKLENYNKLFLDLFENLKNNSSKTIIGNIVNGLCKDLEKESAVTKNITKELKNSNVNMALQLAEERDNIVAEYNQKIKNKDDEEKYKMYLKYSKKIKPLNEKLEKFVAD